jgi:hypothetical protein
MDLPLLALFAQMRGRPPAFGPENFIGICIQLVLVVIGIAIQILYLLNLYKTLNAISPRNREMEPGMVFLNLIPLFGLVWQFFVVLRLADSLRQEYRDRGMSTANEGFGYGAGLTMAIGACLCCGPVALVGMIMHWVQINGYRTRLEQRSKRRRRDEDEDYDDEE